MVCTSSSSHSFCERTAPATGRMSSSSWPEMGRRGCRAGLRYAGRTRREASHRPSRPTERAAVRSGPAATRPRHAAPSSGRHARRSRERAWSDGPRAARPRSRDAGAGRRSRARVDPDDCGAGEVAGLDLPDQHRQFAVEPAEDAVHEDQTRRVATRSLIIRSATRKTAASWPFRSPDLATHHPQHDTARAANSRRVHPSTRPPHHRVRPRTEIWDHCRCRRRMRMAYPIHRGELRSWGQTAIDPRVRSPHHAAGRRWDRRIVVDATSTTGSRRCSPTWPIPTQWHRLRPGRRLPKADRCRAPRPPDTWMATDRIGPFRIHFIDRLELSRIEPTGGVSLIRPLERSSRIRMRRVGGADAHPRRLRR